jgi:hypothetical protein
MPKPSKKVSNEQTETCQPDCRNVLFIGRTAQIERCGWSFAMISQNADRYEIAAPLTRERLTTFSVYVIRLTMESEFDWNLMVATNLA